MGRRRSTTGELSAQVRRHFDARSLAPSGRLGVRIHLVALYLAFAVIAAIVFGTLPLHPF